VEPYPPGLVPGSASIRHDPAAIRSDPRHAGPMRTNPPDPALAAELDTIRRSLTALTEQNRVILELLRQLLALLVPKDDDRPQLGEILAAIVTLLRQISSNVDDAAAGVRRLEDGSPAGRPEGGGGANGRARP